MTAATAPRAIRLHASDNVLVAVDPILPGVGVEGVTVSGRVGRGHKLAIRPIAAGEPVRKFGQVIGFAARETQRPTGA